MNFTLEEITKEMNVISMEYDIKLVKSIKLSLVSSPRMKGGYLSQGDIEKILNTLIEHIEEEKEKKENG